MYRQAHKKRRLWAGEDYFFSTVVRDKNGVAVDISSATVTLTIVSYDNTSPAFSAQLTTSSGGVASATLSGSEMYKLMIEGLYRYVVTVEIESILKVSESGTIQLIVSSNAGFASNSSSILLTQSEAPGPLDASFSYEENYLSVAFTSTSTGDIVSTIWNFGDGGISTSETETHEYSSAGSYTVSVTVVDASGETDTYSEIIEIQEAGEFSGSIATDAMWKHLVVLPADSDDELYSAVDYDDSAWAVAQGPFGSRDDYNTYVPAGVVGKEIWQRVAINFEGLTSVDISVVSDDGCWIWWNGEPKIVARPNNATLNITGDDLLSQNILAVKVSDAITSGDPSNIYASVSVSWNGSI